MSLLDKALAAVTPPETREERDNVRSEARAAARPGDWLCQVIDHHARLEVAFEDVRAAPDAAARLAAQQQLGILLTGHAIAEESVLYPALAQIGEKDDASQGYEEQAEVKMQMAALGAADPMTDDYLDRLEHVRAAVAHHAYEEEGDWFRKLRDIAAPDVQETLTARFREEFDRYVGAYADGDRLPDAPRPAFQLTPPEDLWARAERSAMT